MGSWSTIQSCRLCSSESIEIVWDLGLIAYSGIFYLPNEVHDSAPLRLGRCQECLAVQLLENFNRTTLYGSTYGYESGLNHSMSSHLKKKARILEKKFLNNKKNGLIVDIASNDGTLLSGYQNNGLHKIGIDPLIDVFQDNYPDNAEKRMAYFDDVSSSDLTNRADIVTSCSVFYDLEKPIDFARNVQRILSSDGVWHLEQSYLPSMLLRKSFDTICHEHLLYLSLKDLSYVADKAHLKIVDVTFNDINGGSFAVTMTRKESRISVSPSVDFYRKLEKEADLGSGASLVNFMSSSLKLLENLGNLILDFEKRNCEIVGLGASTKGNVLLQLLDRDVSQKIHMIGDINPRKFGKVTPGTHIPIVPESSILEGNLSQEKLALVLPWHFRKSFEQKTEEFLSNSGFLVFPLPEIEIVSA